MAKQKSAPKPERRPRKEIDGNYFFGDVFIKTGVAAAIALGLIALYTPGTLAEAITDEKYDYLAVLTVFGLLGLAAFLFGRHLRRQATHWDMD